eukprot:6785371-Karenia_brevis.AAC.1
MRQDSGSIVFSETLSAKKVQRKHISVECARNSFQGQNMSTNSGAIVFNKKIAVEVVVIQSAPIRTVACVLAATT